MKNVCVPRLAVSAKYESSDGLRQALWKAARCGVSHRTMGISHSRGQKRHAGSRDLSTACQNGDSICFRVVCLTMVLAFETCVGPLHGSAGRMLSTERNGDTRMAQHGRPRQHQHRVKEYEV